MLGESGKFCARAGRPSVPGRSDTPSPRTSANTRRECITLLEAVRRSNVDWRPSAPATSKAVKMSRIVRVVWAFTVPIAGVQ